MGATTIVVVIVAALAGTYLYVMALCHLADLLAQRKEDLKQQAEIRRKEVLRQSLHEAEMRRKKEEERRRQLIRARNERGIVKAGRVSTQRARHPRPKSASAARA